MKQRCAGSLDDFLASSGAGLASSFLAAASSLVTGAYLKSRAFESPPEKRRVGTLGSSLCIGEYCGLIIVNMVWALSAMWQYECNMFPEGCSLAVLKAKVPQSADIRRQATFLES